MCKEDEIDRAHKIDKGAGRTGQMQLPASQSSKDMFDSKLGGRGDTRVMAPEGVQPMRVGSSDQRLAKERRYFFCAPIWIEEPLVKMAEFDRVKAIDFCNKARPD